MSDNDGLIYETDTPYGPFQVVDMIYEGRPARVLFSGERLAAQSGIATDGKPQLLFDYNQRFMELLESLEPEPRSLLLIGGGALTLPMALRARFPELSITVVEINPTLPQIAETYFGYQPDDKLQVRITDGRSFLAESQETYDVILLDAYSSSTMPKDLMTVEAAQAFAVHLKPAGVIAANVISSYYGARSVAITQLAAALKSVTQDIEIYPANKSLLSFWMPQNFVLVGWQAEPLPLEMRFPAMEPIEVDAEDAWRDES